MKRRAAELIEHVGTWQSGGAGPDQARDRVRLLGLSAALAAQTSALLGPAERAVTRVIFAQYGGIAADSASVLVVAEQWLAQADGAVTQTGTTLDVRLSRSSPRWTVTSVHPAEPQPEASASALVTKVVANGRIRLPVAARADVRSGTVSTRVLRALLALARDHAIDISVIESGHPINVFGTQRQSDHPKGLAVDIWAIDGHPVVEPPNHSLASEVMRAGIALGAYQAGGPVLPTESPAYFSDDTHRDHIHLGFRAS